MLTQNVTLSIPKTTLRRAKLIAVEQGVSLSRLLVELVERMVEQEDSYTAAQAKHLALLQRGFDLGTQGRRVATREELHERRG